MQYDVGTVCTALYNSAIMYETTVNPRCFVFYGNALDRTANRVLLLPKNDFPQNITTKPFSLMINSITCSDNVAVMLSYTYVAMACRT